MLFVPVKKLAVYEPPISINKSFPLYWLPEFETALKNGRRKKAMAISLKGLQVVEGISKMPLWIVMLMINILSFLERKKEKGTRMLDLLPTLTADVKMAMALDSTFARYSHIQIPISLMAGSKSPDYFHQGINALSKILPHAETKIFEGFDHYSPEEKVTDIGGYLKEFFAA